MKSLNSQYRPGADPTEKLQFIENELTEHIGQYALVREKSGRNIISYFVYLNTAQTALYWCFDNRGRRRCTLTKYISFIDVMTNNLSIVFLDR